MGNITSYQWKCKEYHNKHEKWCKSCQISKLEKNFIKWTSGNEKIDKLIQEIQLKVENPRDIVFEWIPYDQFCNYKKLVNYGLAELYSATWKNVPLIYKINKKKYVRSQNKVAVLKCLNRSQNTTNEFLDKVYNFLF